MGCERALSPHERDSSGNFETRFSEEFHHRSGKRGVARSACDNDGSGRTDSVDEHGGTCGSGQQVYARHWDVSRRAGRKLCAGAGAGHHNLPQPGAAAASVALQQLRLQPDSTTRNRRHPRYEPAAVGRGDDELAGQASQNRSRDSAEPLAPEHADAGRIARVGGDRARRRCRGSGDRSAGGIRGDAGADRRGRDAVYRVEFRGRPHVDRDGRCGCRPCALSGELSSGYGARNQALLSFDRAEGAFATALLPGGSRVGESEGQAAG